MLTGQIRPPGSSGISWCSLYQWSHWQQGQAQNSTECLHAAESGLVIVNAADKAAASRCKVERVREPAQQVRKPVRTGKISYGFKTGSEVVQGNSEPIWIHLDWFPAQTKPWRPKTGHSSLLANQIWVFVEHILRHLLETMDTWVQMAMLKRRALKNDPDNRWNVVKWTNGGPNLTRKIGWNWG